MKKLLLVCLSVSLLFFSCNKDQRVVKQLSGSWMIESRTYNGVAAPASEINGITYNFKSCKLKEGDCDGSITAPDSTKGTITFDFKYSITEKGTKFNIKVSLLGIVSNSITADIVDHSKSKFVYQYIDEQTTSTGAVIKTTTVETLKKI